MGLSWLQCTGTVIVLGVRQSLGKSSWYWVTRPGKNWSPWPLSQSHTTHTHLCNKTSDCIGTSDISQSLCDAVTLPGAAFVTVTKRRGLSVKADSCITPLPTVSAGEKVWWQEWGWGCADGWGHALWLICSSGHCSGCVRGLCRPGHCKGEGGPHLNTVTEQSCRQ